MYTTHTKINSYPRLAKFIEFMGIPDGHYSLVTSHNGPNSVMMVVSTTKADSREIVGRGLSYGITKLKVCSVLAYLIPLVELYQKGTTEYGGYGWNYGPVYEQDFEITPDWRPEKYQ